MGAGTKALELVGLALIGGTIYSFVGMHGHDLQWHVFWSCAAGTLAIVILRKYRRERAVKEDSGSGGDVGIDGASGR